MTTKKKETTEATDPGEIAAAFAQLRAAVERYTFAAGVDRERARGLVHNCECEINALATFHQLRRDAAGVVQ